MPSRHSLLAALSGIVVAFVAAYVLLLSVLVVLLLIPSLRPDTVPSDLLLRPLHRVLRLTPYLAFGGGLSGLLRLRHLRLLPVRRWLLRVLSSAGLSLLFALAAALTVQASYAGHFWFTIERHRFVPFTPEASVRARLGTPNVAQSGADALFLPFCQCTNGRAEKILAYDSRSGGTTKIFCFDAAGRFLCEAVLHSI